MPYQPRRGHSMLPNNTPADATKISFSGQFGHGNYYIWPANGMWYWSALGNGGSEKDMVHACNAARRWIKDSETAKAQSIQESC